MIIDYLQDETALQPGEIETLQGAFDRLKRELDIESEDDRARAAAAMIQSYIRERSCDLAMEAGRRALFRPQDHDVR